MQRKTKKSFILSMLSIILLGLLFSCSSDDSAHSKKTSAQTADTGLAAKKTDYLKGKVVQTMDSGGYTYVLLDRNGAQLWVAMPMTKVSIGAELTLDPGIEMKNFTSNTLKRTFDRIIFSSGPVSGGALQNSSIAANATPHAIVEKKDIKVERAKDPDSYTISEIYGAKATLDGRHVTVKGVVIKVSTGIMGKNWIHLQDGSGSQQKYDFDLTITSQDQPAVGDVVTARGPIRTDKDFGAGYRYAVIMEDAKIQKD